MIKSSDLYEVENALNQKKKELNLNGEIKWTKVSANYLEKYMDMMDIFFSFVKAGKVKVRIMFRSMNDQPTDISRRTVDDKYFKLYYEFIKHSFGLKDIPDTNLPAKLIIYLDVLPDKKGQRETFKDYVTHIPNIWGVSDLSISKRDIREVDSHDHVLLQCTDIIMGSMNFKLNKLNRVIPEGSNRRGKRTVAKEKLYQHIYYNICEIHPHFNAGISTGSHGYEHPHWESPYEHWRFIPN